MVEGEGGIDLVLKEVAGVSGAVALGSPPWIMNSGMTRWKVRPLKKGVVRFFWVVASIQGLVPWARPMKLAVVMGRFLGEKLAGEAAHGGVDDDGGAGGDGGREELGVGGGAVGEVACGGWRCRCGLGGCGEGENGEAESGR